MNFCGRKFCGIYFYDLPPYLQKRFRSNKENATSYEKLYNFQRKHTKTGENFQKLVPENIVFLGFWAKISS